MVEGIVGPLRGRGGIGVLEAKAAATSALVKAKAASPSTVFLV